MKNTKYPLGHHKNPVVLVNRHVSALVLADHTYRIGQESVTGICCDERPAYDIIHKHWFGVYFEGGTVQYINPRYVLEVHDTLVDPLPTKKD